MNKIRKWYRNMMWHNLPLFLIAATCLILLLLFRPQQANMINLRFAGAIVCGALILYDGRCYKATSRGLYCAMWGIPYRFVAWAQVSDICVTQKRETVISLSLNNVLAKKRWCSHLLKPFSNITVKYSAKNAAIIHLYYQKSFEEGDTAK